ncbi:MAG: ABC transporter ATP-binding protein [Thermodesulfovibrionales bacterium]
MALDWVLKAEDVTFSYHGRIPALLSVSLEAAQGEKFAVIGSNGSGKSTLFQVLAGLVRPDSGRVLFRGREVTAEALEERSFLRFFRGRVGYVFQDPDVQLFCPTVLDDILYGPLQLGVPEAEARERAAQVMAMLEIERLADRPPYMLSGGEKKRAALGTVLAMNPEVLLLDEPMGGLDPRTQCFLVELMLRLHEAGKTIVIATHDLSVVAELDARVAVLSEDHRIERTGPAEEILGDEDLLLRVNLIHEHMHYHAGRPHAHRHSHHYIHRHGGRGPRGG